MEATRANAAGGPGIEGLGSTAPSAGLRGLPPEAIAADQSGRALAALAEAVASSGYGALTVEQVVERARISRKTFYQLFADKAEAYRAAREEALARLAARLAPACAAEGDWPAAVAAALAEALRWASAEPREALLLCAAPLSAGPRPGECDELLLARFAPGLRRGRELAAAEPPLGLEGAVIGGLAAVVGARLRAGDRRALLDLAPPLTRFALAAYLGPREASSLAGRG